jgi:DOPA 4,5-dioxygenase
MTSGHAPYHAHIYFELDDRAPAERLHRHFVRARATGDLADLRYVGEMRDRPVGPHPKPQFEIHFLARALPAMTALIRQTGLRALVHPLTDDDLADHTTLATWIGEPIALDESVLDPPGRNQGVARFGKSDF